MAVVKNDKTVGDTYEGLSSDTKPTGVVTHSTYLETDTGLKFITYNGTDWLARPEDVPGLHKHLAASFQIKTGAGVLHSVVINRPDDTATATVTLHDAAAVGDIAAGNIIAIITMDKAVFVIPQTLQYKIAFTEGLYVLFSHTVGADITVSYN